MRENGEGWAGILGYNHRRGTGHGQAGQLLAAVPASAGTPRGAELLSSGRLPILLAKSGYIFIAFLQVTAIPGGWPKMGGEEGGNAVSNICHYYRL